MLAVVRKAWIVLRDDGALTEHDARPEADSMAKEASMRPYVRTCLVKRYSMDSAARCHRWVTVATYRDGRRISAITDLTKRALAAGGGR